MIKPLGKNVTAVIVEGSNVTKSGLYLADNASKALAPKVAKILAVGSEVTGVKKDDQVVFKPYATYEVKADDIDYVMLEEEDILGVITEG